MRADDATPTVTPGLDRLGVPDRPASDGAAERARLQEIAAEFESMLMLEMIKQMRQALVTDDEPEEGLGAESFTSTIDSQLTQYLARAGGVGLQPVMLEAWDRQQVGGVGAGAIAETRRPTAGVDMPAALAGLGASAERTAAVRNPSAHHHHEEALTLDMSARVSSAYGWRADPFHGRSKFHSGIDLAAGYGTPVPSAGGGTVVSAAEQGGYGLMVVVRHPGGYESRYAHLASIDVRVGDEVGQGTVLGRVGSSGRSTAPHLHFEVTRAGQRVDPEQFVRNLTTDTKGQ